MKLNDKLKKIKQSFRLYMNGPASQSMREKGLNYNVNWGVPLINLHEMAKEYGKDYELAVALFKENVRECKILATLIMPADRMEADLAEVWLEQTRTQEIAEMLIMPLFLLLNVLLQRIISIRFVVSIFWVDCSERGWNPMNVVLMNSWIKQL